MRGKELVDEGLAVVMNHRAAHAAVVVLVTSNDAPSSVALMFGDHDFLVSGNLRDTTLASGTDVLDAA